jgi:hypothetical protein
VYFRYIFKQMPVYEEKLISPLAVRFTQEHIKTVFRDMHVVEETAAQIEAHPGMGDDYDLVLHAPFPQIEIIRWGTTRIVDEEEGGYHWFTLDNRRLYCLQRAAMRHWPLRVAAKVEILYADPGVLRRKYDSTTLGASVTVAHSCKDAPLFRWDWRMEVQACAHNGALTATCSKEHGAWDAVARDDEKEEVDELADVSSGPGSILTRALEYELAKTSALPESAPKRSGPVRCPTPSTSAASEDSDGTPRHSLDHGWSFERAQGSADWQRQPGAKGTRRDGRAMQATQALLEITHQLRAPNSDGRLRIPAWNERYGKCLGSLRRFLEARPDTFVVIPEREGKFRVREVMEGTSFYGESSCGSSSSHGSRSSGGDTDAVAAQAIAEIKTQLGAQGGAGSVRIDDWNGRYAQSLGPFKAFIRGRPEDFEVVRSSSSFFKIALSGHGRVCTTAGRR